MMTISGITFPSGACQKQLLQEIYSEARVEDIPLAGYPPLYGMMTISGIMFPSGASQKPPGDLQ